ncbi:hypothetical protein DSI35_28980 [Mycobacterium tuberculosis]|uniref:Uncharacterized protein n=4 Tax=Mycobacterium tuberculosis complex TaxID=77643 RepID=Q8VKG0_MYCTO|nr:hypothetical protein MT0724.1 [Mycobacterium tuberculosis CDC1551]AKR00303.1 hypothetical protein Mb1595_p0780 [Mycobacterium tuberculosis variant bovis]APR56162.1 hypothetical protein BTU11_03755 [Mycobacterium tuberculosis]AYP11166.1 hypothetical protein EBQ37_04205 [Mycobacterium tuberculosis variant bovis BCG]EFD72346.1 conserved hypothetical protein [Mycobacterium tuberculosis GM 1503]EFP35848.1 hypothetical protein TMGG_03717 [Mycobacterium tuberculosis SUMu007]KAK28121.1 hypothetica
MFSDFRRVGRPQRSLPNVHFGQALSRGPNSVAPHRTAVVRSTMMALTSEVGRGPGFAVWRPAKKWLF